MFIPHIPPGSQEVYANKIDVQYRRLGVRFLVKELRRFGLTHTSIYRRLTNQD